MRVNLPAVVAIVVLFAVGCTSTPAEDEQACQLWDGIVTAVNAGTIDEEQLMVELEEAWLAAGSDRLGALLDDMMLELEEGGDSDPSPAALISNWCGL